MNNVDVCIDNFKGVCRSSNHAFYVLTHAHTDHARFSPKFKGNIYCSKLTKVLMQDLVPRHVRLCDVLNPDLGWHQLPCDDSHSTRKIQVFCFASSHCLGSIGIYCPELSELHFGEGRPETDVIKRLLLTVQMYPPKTKLRITCDDFVSSSSLDFTTMNLWPSLADTQDLLNKLFTYLLDHNNTNNTTNWNTGMMNDETKHVLSSHVHKNVSKRPQLRVLLPHFGALSALPQDFYYQFVKLTNFTKDSQSNKENIAEELCFRAFGLMNFKHGSDIQIVRLSPHRRIDKSQDTFDIVPSLRWWITQTAPLNFYVPAYDSKMNVLRVFLSEHASPHELLNSFNGMCNKS